VYQNEWVQPVLCKVHRYNTDEQPYIYDIAADNDIYGENTTATAKETLLDCIMNKQIFDTENREDILKLKDMVIKSKLTTGVKCDLLEYINSEDDKALKSLQRLVYDFLEAAKAIDESTDINNIYDWVHFVVERLDPQIHEYSRKQVDLVVALILLEQSFRDVSYRNILNKFTEVYQSQGGVF
ncbi:MAG: hypothetical protein UD936_03340, partial [Acutalibacteraceae bacterium]|nr:hypothetical protein [Acutalibacteraceae bacterium]